MGLGRSGSVGGRDKDIGVVHAEAAGNHCGVIHRLKYLPAVYIGVED